MNLLDLPLEVGALILSYLDKVSHIKAYSVLEIRHFYAYLPNFMRKFDVSGSTLASVKTLHLDLFQDYATKIQELNLSKISDLTAGQLAPQIQRCSNLKTLDVTFTNIYLSELEDICPENVKNISINFFKWPYPNNKDEWNLRSVIFKWLLFNKRGDEWKKGIDFFQRQRFENVHFIIFESFSTHTPLLFMNEVPKTKSLKITVIEYNLINVQQENVLPEVGRNIDINCETLNYIFRDCRVEDNLTPIINLNYNLIEYICIMYSPRCSRFLDMYVSPVFSSLFAKNYSPLSIGVHTHSHLPSQFQWDGEMCIIFKCWQKSCTQFDDFFLKTVLTELKDYFPTYVCMHDKIEMKISQAPSNWYCIDSCQGFETILDRLPEKVTLTVFCRKEGSWVQTNRAPVYLTPSNTLQNITFLRLSAIRLRGDFFATLFDQSKNLCTLVIEIQEPLEMQQCTLSLSNSIHLAKSLRNFEAIAQSIEHELLFAALSHCPTLENIHVLDYERDTGDIDGLRKVVIMLIEKCQGLYSLFIETEMLEDKDLKVLESSLRLEAQKLDRDHLRITVCMELLRWNPFAHVFDPSPLHIRE